MGGVVFQCGSWISNYSNVGRFGYIRRLAPPVEVAGGGCSQQLKITCYLLLLLRGMADEWVATQDAKGNTFYVNHRTKRTSWTKPTDESILPDGWTQETGASPTPASAPPRRAAPPATGHTPHTDATMCHHAAAGPRGRPHRGAHLRSQRQERRAERRHKTRVIQSEL